jgi:hypothetical protein
MIKFFWRDDVADTSACKHRVAHQKPGFCVYDMPGLCSDVEYKMKCLSIVQTATDFGHHLANEASPLYTTTIVEKCTQKLVDDWNYMRTQVSSISTRAA